MITSGTRRTAAHQRFRRVFAYLLLAVSMVLGMLTVATTTASGSCGFSQESPHPSGIPSI